VRIELPNPRGLLKPAMYGRVELASPRGKDKVLAIPQSAVLYTGTRQLVLVDIGQGRFEPRAVKLGSHGDEYVEVVDGLAAGEAVVVSANFLIDAESNLKSALDGFGRPTPGSAPAGDGQARPGAPLAAPGAAPAPVHHGSGEIKEMDWAHATVTIAHNPIASLDWPAMTMGFRARDPALLRPLKPGQKVDFEIVEESGSEYVIVRIQPLDASAATAAQREL
jgi:Cu(I)/Ag(I) efflux system membrane fusion protein